MTIEMEPLDFLPDVGGLIFTGRFVLGNRLGDVEHAIRQRIQQGPKS